MEASDTVTNVAKILSAQVLANEAAVKKLREGDLYSFERDVLGLFIQIFELVMREVLQTVAKQVCQTYRARYQASGLHKWKPRRLRIELHTGGGVEVESLYAKSVRGTVEGSRHLIERHWCIHAGCSPLRMSQIGMCSALCPSYDTANEILSLTSSTQSVGRLRNATMELARQCAQKEVSLCLAKGESLAGKHVLISIDGGRTRTRIYPDESAGKKAGCTYHTPWCEPKVFVIQALDEHKKAGSIQLPIYGARFGEEDVLGLLSQYLQALHIDQATSVQLVADGAAWIWANIPNMLVSLGVPKERITETLDHIHAVEYLNNLINAFPKYFSNARVKELTQQFPAWLWQGKIDKIITCCKLIFMRPRQEVKRWINYLEKHKKRMQYAHFKENNQACGSGIIESGIRRIINLRFKNASTFWYKENVEKLFFLRATCLAKRWNIFIHNLLSLHHP